MPSPSQGSKQAHDSVEKAGDQAKGVVETAKDYAHSAVDKAKDFAGSASDKAKDFAGSAVDKAKDLAGKASDALQGSSGTVGSGLEAAAGKLRDVAPGGRIGSAANVVADKLEAGGQYLREEGVSGLGRDLGEMIKNNPVPAVLIGIGLGFLLARATRS